jgi:diguanylate cyclase (GGDEF)-like protein
MISPPLPPNEAERLAALHALDLLHTPAEDRFDRITRVARELFQVPMARITLVDADREWFKSRQGFVAGEGAREHSFSAHAILEDKVLWIENATDDERFHDNPLVAGSARVRFYAGYPIRTTKGQCVGTLCIMDTAPRAHSAQAATLLADLGRIAGRELEAPHAGTPCAELADKSPEQRRKWIDDVTGVWNRDGMLEILRRSLSNCAEQKLTATVLLVELDISAKVSEKWSAAGHDVIVAEIAQILRNSIPHQDTIGRTRGEQFTVIFRGLPVGTADERVAEIRKRLEANPVLRSMGVPLHLGHTCVTPGSASNDVEAELDNARRSLARARWVTLATKT